MIARRVLSLILFILFAAVVTGVAQAVPADPNSTRAIQQPDGTRFVARLIGDERTHRYETEDGYAIARNPDGNWAFAERGPDGGLQPSSRIVGRNAPATDRHLKPSASWLATTRLEQTAAPLGVTAVTPASITGTHQAVIILVQFSDTPAGEGATGPHDTPYFTHASSGIVTGSNQGTMHDYFDEVSYGQFTLQATVAAGAWHTSTRTEGYYGGDCNPGACLAGGVNDNCNGCISELAREAIRLADSAGFDFSPYDQDADGVVDHVVIVHAGRNQAELAGGPNDIWSHNGTIPATGEIVDGVAVKNYVMVSEWDAMNVYAHEFAHDLGAPDLYDRNFDSEPVGDWCLMASNTGNDRPPHLCGFLKIDLDGDLDNGTVGWATPQVLGASGVYTLSRLDQNATGSVLMTNPAFSHAERFVVENRQRGGYYDGSVPESGLIFTHLDMDMPDGAGRFNDGTPANSYHGAWIERPLNRASADSAAYSADDNETAFAPWTAPTTDANGGVGTGLVFQNVGSEGAQMSLEFLPGPSYVGGVTGVSTTWRAANSPYIVQTDFTVEDGDTLTIEPGVVVKFMPSRKLIVNGTLRALGTASHNIVFTSYKDDQHGGDTNANGPSVGARGDWKQIQFEGPDPGCVLNYCLIRYAGQVDYVSTYNEYRYNAVSFNGTSSTLAMTSCLVEETAGVVGTYNVPYAIYARAGTTLSLSSCTIRNNQVDGLYSVGSNLTVQSTRIHGNGRAGLYSTAAGTAVRNCAILNNGGDGLYLTGATCAVVSDTVSTNVGLGIYCPSLPSEFTGNISTANGSYGFTVPANVVDRIWTTGAMSANGRGNAISVSGGTVTSTTTWIDEHPYLVTTNMFVADAVTLTLEPGVVMKFGSGIIPEINGTLNATGTESARIVFTSYRDDSLAGDTNGGGASVGSRGDWRCLYFNGADAGCALNYCVVRYAGGSSTAIVLSGTGTSLTVSNSVIEETSGSTGSVSYAALQASSATSLTLESCDIRRNSGSGVYCYGTTLTVRNTRIVGNAGPGIYSTAAGTVVRNCMIMNNGGDGLYLSGAGCTVVADTVSTNGGMGIYCPSLPAEFTGNIGTANGSFGFYVPANVVDRIWTTGAMSANGRGDAIAVSGGTVTSTTTWIDEHPYMVGPDNIGSLGRDVVVADGVTLTLEPGVVMKFGQAGLSYAQYRNKMQINGTLYAAGTESDRIVFTSYRDDSYGGDTNGDGASAGSRGDWRQLYFNGADAGCMLSYCVVRYAGYMYSTSDSANAIHVAGIGTSLTVSNSVIEETLGNMSYPSHALSSEAGTSLTLESCDIRNNSADGILSAGTALTVRNSRITGNGRDGIYSTSAATVVRNCRIANNVRDGLRMSSGASCEAVGDTLLANGGEGLYLGLQPGAFLDNYAAGNGKCGYVLPVPMIQQAWLTNSAQNGEEIGVLAGNVPAGSLWIDEHPIAVYGNIVIPHDVDLTLEPGSILKFNTNIMMTVNGTLIANGSAGDEIVFTSYRDDAYGGDTNGDGASIGVPGDWQALVFTTTNAGCSMQYCRVRYAGQTQGPAVSLTGAGAGLTMTDCIVEQTGGAGTAPYAIRVNSGAQFQMLDSRISDNLGHGVYLAEPTALAQGCLASGNRYHGFYVLPELVGEIAGQDSLSANGWGNSIGVLAGTITQDDAWPGTYPYVLNGSVTVNAGATVVLYKGATVKFNGNQSLLVRGGLVAQGDAVDKVVFTSFKNDNYGGDTNADGINTVPARGDWGQIRFDGATTANLSWIIVSYGGYGSVPALKLDTGTYSFSECIVRDNLARGVQVGTAAQLTLTNSDVCSNGYGLENLNTGATADARNCWWGDPSGPGGVGPGTGDAVSARVQYDPWLGRSIDNPWVAFTSPATTGNFMDVLTIDLDGDPLLDLIAATEGSGLQVWRREAFETWSSVTSPITSGQYMRLEKGDLDADGHDDFMAAGAAGIRCFTGNGSGGFTETSAPLVGAVVNDVKFAHVDHDAHLDIVACSGNNSGIWVFHGDGAGSWTAGVRPATTGSFNRIAARDLNNDTYLDLVATSAEYSGVRTWYGAADGSWTAGATIGAGQAYYGLDLGDIDKDGWYDIVAGTAVASTGISVFRNNHAGGWTALPGPTTTGRFSDLILADLNGDLKLDLAAANLFGGISVWVGTSSLNWNYWYHPASTSSFNGIFIGDFTLNGSLDLAGASTINGLRLWDNLTPGAFQEYFATTPDRIDFGRVALGRCAHSSFEMENVSPDTLHNVVVYTTNPAFTITSGETGVGPFDLLPDEIRTFEVTYCPTQAVAENEVVIIHSTQSVTHVGISGEGVLFIEPVWSLPILVSNVTGGSGNSQSLLFGAAIGATDSLDVQSGENGLPPAPPAAIFDARFDVLGTEGSRENYHDFYRVSDTFTFRWQPGTAGYPVTITWNPAALPSGTFMMGTALKDTVDMATHSSYVVPAGMEYITELHIWTTSLSTAQYQVRDGWQLVSRAVSTADDSLSALFPGAVSAFSFNGGYAQAFTLAPGRGYWLDMPAAGTVQHVGEQVRRIQLTLPAGWNLVGAPYDTFTVASIAQTPPGSIRSVYGFNYSYQLASQLIPGQGYWMDLSQPCEITIDLDSALRTGPSRSAPPATDAVAATWELPITLIPAAGARAGEARELRIGAAPGATANLDVALGEREVPPWPPGDVFEARVAGSGNGFYRDLRDPAATKLVYEIVWHGADDGLPLTITWDPTSLPAGASAVLTSLAEAGGLPPVDMRTSGRVDLPAQAASLGGVRIEVRLGAEAAGVPAALALGLNVPNPFNRSTSIAFDLDREGEVKLQIYDMAGRLVKDLGSRRYSAGRYNLIWDGSDERASRAPSGTYVLRLLTGGRSLTRKISLVR